MLIKLYLPQALFNLIPIPPLDGYHVLANFSRGYASAMHGFMMSGGAIIGLLIVFSISGRLIAPMAAKASIGYLDMIRNKDIVLEERPRVVPLPRRRFGDEVRNQSEGASPTEPTILARAQPEPGSRHVLLPV